jgi:hypothetical protein
MKSHRPTIMGTHHMIAATQYLAAEAGFKILEAGGNAIDAGVAAGIALGVVQPEFVNVAGVAPIIIYSAVENRVVTIPGLGTLAEGDRSKPFQEQPRRPNPAAHWFASTISCSRGRRSAASPETTAVSDLECAEAGIAAACHGRARGVRIESARIGANPIEDGIPREQATERLPGAARRQVPQCQIQSRDACRKGSRLAALNGPARPAHAAPPALPSDQCCAPSGAAWGQASPPGLSPCRRHSASLTSNQSYRPVR